MTNRTLKTALYATGAVALALSVTTASFAQFQRNQTSQNQQRSNPLGDLIGMIANASAKSKAKKSWAQVTPEIQQCVNIFVGSRNLNVDALIAAGMSPSDEQMAPIITMCQSVMATQLKTNFPCSVANAKGQQVPTTCVQSYAKAVNGKWVPVSRDDFLRAGSNNEQVNIADFETTAAQNARLAQEQITTPKPAKDKKYWGDEEESRRIEFIKPFNGKKNVIISGSKVFSGNYNIYDEWRIPSTTYRGGIYMGTRRPFNPVIQGQWLVPFLYLSSTPGRFTVPFYDFKKRGGYEGYADHKIHWKSVDCNSKIYFVNGVNYLKGDIKSPNLVFGYDNTQQRLFDTNMVFTDLRILMNTEKSFKNTPTSPFNQVCMG